MSLSKVTVSVRDQEPGLTRLTEVAVRHGSTRLSDVAQLEMVLGEMVELEIQQHALDRAGGETIDRYVAERVELVEATARAHAEDWARLRDAWPPHGSEACGQIVRLHHADWYRAAQSLPRQDIVALRKASAIAEALPG